MFYLVNLKVYHMDNKKSVYLIENPISQDYHVKFSKKRKLVKKRGN